MRHLVSLAGTILVCSSAITVNGCAARERTIPVESVPRQVRAGFARESGGAEPIKVDWQRTPGGT
jgi:hypothetical protein